MKLSFYRMNAYSTTTGPAVSLTDVSGRLTSAAPRGRSGAGRRNRDPAHRVSVCWSGGEVFLESADRGALVEVSTGALLTPGPRELPAPRGETAFCSLERCGGTWKVRSRSAQRTLLIGSERNQSRKAVVGTNRFPPEPHLLGVDTRSVYRWVSPVVQLVWTLFPKFDTIVSKRVSSSGREETGQLDSGQMFTGHVLLGAYCPLSKIILLSCCRNTIESFMNLDSN